ncbi:MAG TPA: sulfite exporter TauE/SafE family protein [Blastocatellia bacterium]|nr:sulfite exporter TauE/SafE family protein [Blastocatellia bacterium]
MTIHLWQGVIIFSAAFAAGMMNSVAGGGTLLTFPALIWMGIDPKAANVTSTIALWPGSLGGMVGYRQDLRDSRRFMLRLAPSSVLGGLVGALLLLKTPSSTFAAIVPFLILFATLLFAAGEPVMRWLRRERRDEQQTAHAATDEPGRAWWAGAIILQFFSATYGGYFGAGNGIVMLAVLGLLGLTDIHQMNGLKNFFAVCINVIASFYFMIWGPVHWPAAAVMTVGAIAGGYGGAGLARRLGRRFARAAVIFIGLAMTLSLLFRR